MHLMPDHTEDRVIQPFLEFYAGIVRAFRLEPARFTLDDQASNDDFAKDPNSNNPAIRGFDGTVSDEEITGPYPDVLHCIIPHANEQCGGRAGYQEFIEAQRLIDIVLCGRGETR
jgi:hypothetical protein